MLQNSRLLKACNRKKDWNSIVVEIRRSRENLKSTKLHSRSSRNTRYCQRIDRWSSKRHSRSEINITLDLQLIWKEKEKKRNTHPVKIHFSAHKTLTDLKKFWFRENKTITFIPLTNRKSPQFNLIETWFNDPSIAILRDSRSKRCDSRRKKRKKKLG